ncbi:MAG: hypothetical protein WBP72_00160 [Rhodocyclaceae bacterium]
MRQSTTTSDHDQSTAAGDEGPTGLDASNDAVSNDRATCIGEGFSDLQFPPIPLPSSNVAELAGEALLRALVKRHHERLRDSSLSPLFPVDPDRFAHGIDRAAAFVVEACGGPRRVAGGTKQSSLRERHFDFTIDEAAREVWLAELLLAFDDVGFPRSLRPTIWNWLEAFSVRMINRRTTLAQPNRYPFSQATVRLRPFMGSRRRPVVCPR